MHQPQHTPTDRRQFLKRAGAAGVALMAGPLLQQDPHSMAAAPIPDGDIDAHSHIWTRDIAKYPLAKGQTLDDLAPSSFTTEELLALARPLGVGRVVLIQHKPYHGLDNSYITDSIAQYPGVFSAVACIDAEGPHPDAEMVKLKEQGVRGFRILPNEGGAARWRDSQGMRTMWDTAAQQTLAMCPLINPQDLSQVDEMCRAFPKTNVVIDHFARIGEDGIIRDADVRALTDLAQHPLVHVKISAYYALGRKQPPYTDLIPMIDKLISAYGAERLMWASDSPYQIVPPNNYADSLALIRERTPGLTATQKEWLLRKTAEKIYFPTI
jgi:L-fuconolactonase